MDAAHSFVTQATTYQNTWHHNQKDQSESWVLWEHLCHSCIWRPGVLMYNTVIQSGPRKSSLPSVLHWKSLCYIGYTSTWLDVRSCVLMQEATTFNMFYDGISIQHLATVLNSVFTLSYGRGLLFHGPLCIIRAILIPVLWSNLCEHGSATTLIYCRSCMLAIIFMMALSLGVTEHMDSMPFPR
jgi:hypothetical protein